MKKNEIILSQREAYRTKMRKGGVISTVEAENTLVFELRRGAITNNGATPWWVSATVGTSTVPQTFKFMMDTGTTNTWVTAKSCSTSECTQHDSFDETASSTFVWQDQSLTPIDFSGWGNMDVNLGNDVWVLSDKNAIDQDVTVDFWLSQSYSGARFGELIQDGFIACGPYGDNSRSNLIFDALWYSGALASPWMSYWVDYTIDGAAVDSGEMIFGGSNADKYDPDTVISLDIVPGIWTHMGDSIVVDGAEIFTSPALLIDTGASEIKGEQAEIDKLIAAVTLDGQLPLSPDNPDHYAYPDLVFNLGKTSDGSTGQLVFPPRAYFNYIEAGTDQGKWQIAMTVLEDLGENSLIFGRNLLDRLYSEWEYDTSGTSVAGKTIRLAQRV
ncbi:pepsin-like aspartic protease [Sinorhizobium medicae]|uniref:pepsin-like aspartic protease n=1 Tax=Sinorhizobium medicae TaxID=110321 RepID=UPI0013E2E2FC|nr:pepsin-like aspartic protease [Sinorhizobium medicae]